MKSKSIKLLLTLYLCLGIGKAKAQDYPYIGEIKLFAGNFAPKNWALCNGQLLPINQNQALFSLLGTTYGGNGVTTFALPDLRGKGAIGFGAAYALGEVGGSETVTLQTANIPAHVHGVMVKQTPGEAGVAPSVATVLANPQNINGEQTAWKEIQPGGNVTILAPQTLGNTGGNQPVNMRSPYATTTFIIALQGIFPSRN